MPRNTDDASRGRALDAIVRDALDHDAPDLRFTSDMRSAVRRATVDAPRAGASPGASRADRWVVAIAAAAVLALTSAVGVLYVSVAHEPEPRFTVSNLPGAALAYNQRREP